MKRLFILISIITIFSLIAFSVIAQEQAPPATGETASEQLSEEVTETEQAGTETGEASIDVVAEESLASEIVPDQEGTVIAQNEINPITLNYAIAGDSTDFVADVEEAFRTWQDVSVGAIEATRSEEATVVFDVADEALMGPDAISLKVLENNLDERDASGAPERLTTILVAESVRDSSLNLYKSALLHEVGLLVGLPLQESGVMQRGLNENVAPSVSVAEARALTTQASTAKEDINRDGSINFYDLVELVKNYSEFPQNFNADITGDGTVNNDDVDQLKEVYEFSDPVDPDASQDSESDQTSVPVSGEDESEVAETAADSQVPAEDVLPAEEVSPEAMAEIMRAAQEQANQGATDSANTANITNTNENEAGSTEENLPQTTNESTDQTNETDDTSEGTSEGQ